MSWIILICSIIAVSYLYYKIRTILYYNKLEKLYNQIKECNITIFKLRGVELHDFNKLLAIQKDLYAKGIKPKGLRNPKYFTKLTPDLTLEDVLMYSIDIWHMDSLDFWNNCSQEIGENSLNLSEDTLHKTLVFNRYRDVLTGSLGDYLYKLKLEYVKLKSDRFNRFR